jgi:hypothetical protein
MPGFESYQHDEVLADMLKTAAAVQFPTFAEWLKENGGIRGTLVMLGAEIQGLMEDNANDWAHDNDVDLDDKTFEDYCLKELEYWYTTLVSNYRKLTFPLPIYRAVRLNGLGSLDTQRAGIFWTHDERSARVYATRYQQGGDDYILKALAMPEDVDWDETLRANVNPAHGEEEQEITLKRGASIKLVGYKEIIETRNLWTPIPDVPTITA